MADLADEETDNSSYADDRPFYKLEKWTKDGAKVDRLLCAGNDLDRGRIVIAPDQIPAQSADLHGSPTFNSAGLHGLMLEDRSSELTQRALKLRPSGRR